MANGFIHSKRRQPVYVSTSNKVAYPDTQFKLCGALEFSNGMLKPINGATDKVAGIYNSLELPAAYYPGSRPVAHKSSTGYGEKVFYTPGNESNDVEYETDMNGVDALAVLNGDALTNTDLSTVKFDYAAGSAGDFTGGCIYADGQQRNITNNTKAGDTHTITVDRPFTRAITAGDKVTATHLNAGMTAVKMSPAVVDMGISAVKGDETGGYVEITEMILNHVRPVAVVIFRK